MKNYIKYMGVIALGLMACEPEFENPVDANDAYSSGAADFSNFVAIGNSITAGYADNALYIEGQQNSYPNIMAEQFAKAGGGDFSQPLVADNYGGLLLNGSRLPGFDTRLVLAMTENGPSPRNIDAEPTTEVSEVLSGPFNNLGVPGMKSFHLVFNGYGDIAGLQTGTANPFYVRFASSPGASILEDALTQNPTFFSLWIGKNDILSYATSGGTGEPQIGNTDPTTYSSDDITDPQLFAKIYSDVVNAFIAAGAEEGVVNAVPDITVAPFFTTIPHDTLNTANAEFAAMVPILNESFVGKFDANGNKIAPGLNDAILRIRGIDESEGDTPFSIEFNSSGGSPLVIKDEALIDISAQLKQVLMDQMGYPEPLAAMFAQQYGQARQATPEDNILLTSASAIAAVNMKAVASWMQLGMSEQEAGQLAVQGITYPLPDQFVLTQDEVEIINTARTQFNTAIQGIAQQNGLAYVDTDAILQQLAGQGISFDGGVVTSTFATGGAFSLDGIHLTPRGAAILANRMIEEINKTYDATVPQVNVGAFGTINLSNDVQ